MCPSTHSCWPLCRPSSPQHSSMVTLATAELPGSQAVCHGQMPTCCSLETPEPHSISSQAHHSPASSDALFAPSPGLYPLEHVALPGSHQAARFLLTSQPEEHHGVTVSSDGSPQHASPEALIRTLRRQKNYREAQKHESTRNNRSMDEDRAS